MTDNVFSLTLIDSDASLFTFYEWFFSPFSFHFHLTFNSRTWPLALRLYWFKLIRKKIPLEISVMDFCLFYVCQTHYRHIVLTTDKQTYKKAFQSQSPCFKVNTFEYMSGGDVPVHWGLGSTNWNISGRGTVQGGAGAGSCTQETKVGALYRERDQGEALYNRALYSDLHVNRMTDIHDWKQYLPETSLVGGINRKHRAKSCFSLI